MIVCHSTAFFLFNLYIMCVNIIVVLNKDLIVYKCDRSPK